MNLNDIWEQVPADYFSTGVKNNILQKIWHLNKLQAVIKAISQDCVPSLLDIGSADGSFINRLEKHTHCSHLIAVDPYFPPLKFGAKHFSNTQYIQGDSHNLPIKSHSIPVITILETLEHVRDPLQTLIELKRVLKKNGYIIVEMDSGNFLFQMVWFFWKKLGKGKVWNNAHLTSFNVQLLEQLFSQAKLKIVNKTYFNLNMGICYKLS